MDPYLIRTACLCSISVNVWFVYLRSLTRESERSFLLRWHLRRNINEYKTFRKLYKPEREPTLSV